MSEKKILNSINSPDDVKKLDKDELFSLCAEIRGELINVISKNGGHLASNLGMVELTVALHRCFNSPTDKIVFDVGHQCYTHKLLTGRRDRFCTLRTEGGISGFTRPKESEHDVFISGHSSTSVSSALGLATANAIKGSDAYTVAVIGDGALSGGLAYEALNNAGRKRNVRLIVILNDNKMSISRNVGAMARHLAVIRSNVKYYDIKSGIERFLQHIPLIGKPLRNFVFRVKKAVKNLIYHSNIFEDMGFYYLGPIDGHDTDLLEHTFETAKKLSRPVLIHVHTVKGKGYTYAEKDPAHYHGISELDIDTGEQLPHKDSFSAFVGRTLCSLAEKDKRICAVSAAMTEGTGLFYFSQSFKERFFDVGIAEAHALTFCSGLSKGGLLPFFAVYSSFLQRGYDQLIHDLSLQELKAVILIDRAGFVGADGETHQGLFDAAFLSEVPGVKIWSPCYFDETEACIKKAAESEENRLFAIRYPRGSQPEKPDCIKSAETEYTLIKTGEKTDTVIVTYGKEFINVYDGVMRLAGEGIKADIIKLTCISPLPEDAVKKAALYKNVFFFEEGMRKGSIGEHLLREMADAGFSGRFSLHAVEEHFVPAATPERCYALNRLDGDSVYNAVKEFLNV